MLANASNSLEVAHVASSQSLETVAVELSNGKVAELRPVVAADAPLFVDGLSRLSESSRFARFGMGIDHLSAQELRYLTDVDQKRHVAFGALIEGDAAGVGRYVVLPNTECAEVAVTVIDKHQRQGLGRALFMALVAVARHDGLETFCFEVTPSNEAVKRILSSAAEANEASGLVEGNIQLSDFTQGEYDDDVVALVERHRAAKP